MRAFAVAYLLALAACTPVGGDATTAPPPTTARPGATSTTVAADLGCPQGVDFVDNGRVLRRDQDESDSVALSGISWTTQESCERFRIRFQSLEGAPATTAPSTTVEFLGTRQVIRVRLTTSESIVIDQLVESALVDRLYVVRALDGGMFIDFHLAAPAQALARVQNSPAALLLDLQPSTLPFEGQAVVSARTVVVEPPDGSELGTRFGISGYSRADQGQVLIIARAGDSVVEQTTAVAADWATMWGEFSTSLEVPAGETSLFVGEEDPADGSLSGVSLRLVNR